MPYASNQGTKIYYEVEGNGPPILFGHGAMGNISMWSDYGYVDMLKERYTLILVDARGHGKSDKFYTHTEYDVKFMVDDVIAVLDDLRIEQTHYLGYSMGGFTGFGVAKYYPHRLHSLILGGASPYMDDEDQRPHPLLEIMQRGVEEGTEAMVEGYRALVGGRIHPAAAARLRTVDPRAMIAFFDFPPDERGIEDVLPTISIPCLLYIGEQDDPEHVLTYAKQIPNASVVVIPGVNHGQTSAAVELIVPQVLEFLGKV